MNYTRKALFGAMWVFIFLVVSAGMSYLFRLLLAKNLSVEDYGLFFAVFSVILFVIIIKDLGLRNALAKFIPEFLSKNDRQSVKSSMMLVFYIHLLTSLLFTAILVFLAPILAKHYFHSVTAAQLMAVFAFALIVSFIEEIFVYSFQGFQKMIYFSMAPAVRMTLVLLITFVLLKTGAGIMAPVYAFLITYAIMSLVYPVLFIKTTFRDFFSVKSNISSSLTKTIFKFGILTMLTFTGGYILSYTDTLVLTYFRTLKEVGWYQVAMPSTTLLWYIPQAVSTIILPMASELWSKNEKGLLSTGIEMAHKYSFVAVVPLALIMLTFPEIMIRVLFGEAYVPAAQALQILAVGAIIFSISTLNTAAFSGIGHPQVNTKIIFTAALINLILNLILIPLYGIIGAASATTISYAVMMILSTARLRQFVKIKEPWTNWAKTAIAGIGFVLVVSVLKNYLEMNVWVETGICLVIAGAAYIILVFLFKVVNINEIKDLAKRAISTKKQDF